MSRIALPGSDWTSGDLSDPLRANHSGNVRSGDIHSSDVVAADFIAGPENRLVVPALERLLTSEDKTEGELAQAAQLFNPLVLLGPTGMGKSHLARGITRSWRAALDDPASDHSTVEYLTAVDFARQLRTAREEGTLDELRNRWAHLQLLVLEDLHRLPDSSYVQRELRDTLDVLTEAGAAIVITAQQSPAMITNLEAGLRDRLSGGLTVRLQNPGVETRFELLRLAAVERGLQIEDEQLQQLAHKVEGPAPQLFRALAEYELARSEKHSGVDENLLEGARPALELKQIIAVVARYYSLTQAALCSSARRKSLVFARGIVIHLARSLTDLSYAQIGQSLGRRDHTTIMHANRTLENRLANDANVQQDFDELKRILTAA